MLYNYEMIKRAMKKHDLLMKIFCWFLIKLGYSNDEIQSLEISNKKYLKLKRKYKKFLNEIEFENNNYDGEINNNVWILWLQGIDKAPEIIKKCNESVKYYLHDKNIHILTEDNLSDYIELPDYILKKYKDNIIPVAQLSDIIRTMLLVKYGGMWLDATVYLTDSIPKYIYKKPLFMFHYSDKKNINIIKNSWFIYAEKENRVLKAVLSLILEYWRKENVLKEYFLWHNFLKMALEKYSSDLNEIYYVSEEMAHALSYCLYKKFDPLYWEQIKKWSSIHKLSYHIYHTENGQKPLDLSNTFYEHVIRKGFDQ